MNISLSKQIHIYSVDTSCFYNDDEMKIHNRLNKLYVYRKKLNKKKNKFVDGFTNECFKKKIKNLFKITNKEIKRTKNNLYLKFKDQTDTRNLREETLTERRIVSVFDSVLTRTLELQPNELTKDIMIIQVYFFDVLKDLILNGFIYQGEKYVYFTSSAGQIRTKKTVFIKEKLYKRCSKSLMCGLTLKEINKRGGVNVNKYLSYLALCNSATDEWNNFDIDRAIVVNDMETLVHGEVDFINDETYKIIRKTMDIPIEHTDGSGMCLPSVSEKNMTIRLPWTKGLLVSFDFKKFIEEKNGNSKIKDVYGKEWDIIEDNIDIILTKSQFKMWGFYDSWEQYKNYFKKYNCQAGICNIEEDELNNAKINYQMLQTLIDITDKELDELAKTTNYMIKTVSTNKRTMLKILGVTPSNKNKNHLQQALEIYPELLADTYSKEILKSVKRKMVKEAKAGKLDINSVYTFISPDMYAFCEYLFLDNKNPKGLLKNGEVFCKVFKDGEKLDCLRAPHLYREHAVRTNTIDIEKNKWFTTNALYTSIFDLISKILQFDTDGDIALVCAESTLIRVAERNMKGIVPLYYNMRNAEKQIINDGIIYDGLITAYTGGNIGIISNNITKIWNSDDVNLDVIKLLCAENNFVIDYAKTLYKPKRPKEINKLINQYTNYKVPHFFIYAKDKTRREIEKINNSTVNKLNKIIINSKVNFDLAKIDEFDYRMLMSDDIVDLDKNIIDKYVELDLNKKFMLYIDKEENNNELYMYQKIKKELLKVNSDENYVVNVLVEYLYKYKESNLKTTLWESFGDILVKNLKNNVKTDHMLCEICGKKVFSTVHNRKYCEECAKSEWQKYNREKQKIYYQKSKNSV